MPRIAGRIGRTAAGVLALFGLGGQPIAARTIAPAQAPRAWVVYAETATETITGWVNSSEPPAPRLRDALVGDAQTTGQAPPPLAIQIWIDREGTLSKVASTAPISAQAGEDLNALLVGRRLSPPPKRMRQPLRLALQVLPDPGAQAPVVAASNGAPVS